MIPRLERSPGGGNDNPLQYSCPWRISWTRLGNRAHMHISLTEALLSPDLQALCTPAGTPLLALCPLWGAAGHSGNTRPNSSPSVLLCPAPSATLTCLPALVSHLSPPAWAHNHMHACSHTCTQMHVTTGSLVHGVTFQNPCAEDCPH